MTREFIEKIVEKISFPNASQALDRTWELEKLYIEELENEKKRDFEKALHLIKDCLVTSMEEHSRETIVEIRSIENTTNYTRLQTLADKERAPENFNYEILKDEIYWENLQNLVINFLTGEGYSIELISGKPAGYTKIKISWYPQTETQKEENHGS